MLSPTHSTVFILLGIIKEEGENTCMIYKPCARSSEARYALEFIIFWILQRTHRACI